MWRATWHLLSGGVSTIKDSETIFTNKIKAPYALCAFVVKRGLAHSNRAGTVRTERGDGYDRRVKRWQDSVFPLPQGSFVVMKTGRHPMRTRLRLFLDWGITFDEPYRIAERIDRPIAYAGREELLQAILVKYPPKDVPTERFRRDREIQRADSPKKANALHVPNEEVFR